MSVSNRGFASLSPAKKREIAGKGGKKAHVVGKAHKFSPLEARSAALKSKVARKATAARKAALRLLNGGFTAVELASLALTEDQYIYYSKSDALMSKLRDGLYRP